MLKSRKPLHKALSRPKAAKKSTAMVRPPRAKVPKAPAAPKAKQTEELVQLSAKTLEKYREGVLNGLRTIEETQPLLDTFNENVTELAAYMLRDDLNKKTIYWAVGRQLEMMETKGVYGAKVVEKATKVLHRKQSSLYEMCNFYKYYPSISHMAEIEDAGLEWYAIQILVSIKDEAVRTRIVKELINNKLPRAKIAAYVRAQKREWQIATGKLTPKPRKTKQQQADAKSQAEQDSTPKNYFASLEQLLVDQWEPVKAKLAKLGVIKSLMAEEKQTSDEEYDAAIGKLHDCRTQVRIWDDNLAVITRLANGVAEP